MKSKFKALLVRLAGMRLSDQRWLLKQLSPEHQRLFEAHQGTSLLKQARRFNKLPSQALQDTKPIQYLPQRAVNLHEKPALYTAIVLSQGQFHWEDAFLNAHPEQDLIHDLTEGVVKQIKPATKACLLQHWQGQLSFDAQLED